MLKTDARELMLKTGDISESRKDTLVVSCGASAFVRTVLLPTALVGGR